MTTILLLTLSNIFMTFAWYGHLKYRHAPLFKVIVISWLIAFAEYCFQVPANRIGSYEFTTAQLKTIPGGHHPNGVFDLLGSISSGTAEVELPRGFRHDDRRGRSHFQEVVRRCFNRRTMVSMRRGSKRAASNPAEGSRSVAKHSKVTRDQVARIRERREGIRQRTGILSDSAILIREDRDR